jgi:hypothetical protein
MSNTENYVPSMAREMRDDKSVVNTAEYVAPRPNNDQVISVAAPGIVHLTVPADTIAAEISYIPADSYIRYGDNVPANGVGAYYPEGSAILLDSYEKATTVNIYVTAACNLFVQYYK